MNKVVVKSLILVVLIGVFFIEILDVFSKKYNVDYILFNHSEDLAAISEYNKNLIIADSVEFYDNGDKGYTVGRLTKSYQDTYNELIAILPVAVKKGSRIEQYQSVAAVISHERIVFDLNMALSKKVLAKEFSFNETKLDIEEINTIGILCEENDNIIVYFADYSRDQINAYELKGNGASGGCEMLDNIKSSLTEKDTLAFEVLNETDLLHLKRIFSPLPNSSFTYDTDLLFIIPYITETGIDFENLDTFVNRFFENPTVKWDDIKSDTEIEFGDDSVVVRYSTDGVFEYTSIVENKVSSIDVSKAYNIADEFLVKDKDLGSFEKILEGYSIDGETITLYYNYYYEDFPIIIGEYISQYNMIYPIEIKIKNDKVANYKRVLLQREDFMPQKSQFISDYNIIVDKFETDYGIKRNDIKRIYLAYIVEEDNYFEMKWIIEYGNTIYTYNVF